MMLAAFVAGCSPSGPTGDPDGAAAPAVTPRSSPTPTEARTPSSRAVVAETLPYGEVDDQLVYGHFAIPADMIDPLPAVVVIHDWWGLNEPMRELTEQLAAEGYIALGIDLFGRETAKAIGSARELEIEVVENPALAIENLQQAVDFLRNTAGAPRVAVLGFGFGGGWSLNAAMSMADDLIAVVSYYGQVVDDERKLSTVSAPILGLYAEGDRAVPADSVRKFRSLMESLEKEVEIEIYPNARRGFADELSDNYDPKLAADAWNRVLDFLEARVREPTD